MDDHAPDHSPTPNTRDNTHGAKTAFEPIRREKSGTGEASHRTAPRSRPLFLQSSRSYGGGDGYGCMSEDERGGSHGQDQPHDPEKEFEVHWDGDNDLMNPRSMSKPRKWLIVLILSATSLCVYVFGAQSRWAAQELTENRTCTSSLYTSTYGQITKEFNCSQIVATLGLSLFVMGLGIGPMLLAPLSEVGILLELSNCLIITDLSSSMADALFILFP
jgi:hypothetical protein